MVQLGDALPPLHLALLGSLKPLALGRAHCLQPMASHFTQPTPCTACLTDLQNDVRWLRTSKTPLKEKRHAGLPALKLASREAWLKAWHDTLDLRHIKLIYLQLLLERSSLGEALAWHWPGILLAFSATQSPAAIQAQGIQ